MAYLVALSRFGQFYSIPVGRNTSSCSAAQEKTGKLRSEVEQKSWAHAGRIVAGDSKVPAFRKKSTADPIANDPNAGRLIKRLIVFVILQIAKNWPTACAGFVG